MLRKTENRGKTPAVGDLRGGFLEAEGFFGGSLESFHESLKSGELSLVGRFFSGMDPVGYLLCLFLDIISRFRYVFPGCIFSFQ